VQRVANHSGRRPKVVETGSVDVDELSWCWNFGKTNHS